MLKGEHLGLLGPPHRLFLFVESGHNSYFNENQFQTGAKPDNH